MLHSGDSKSKEVGGQPGDSHPSGEGLFPLCT